jgi:hypothetical protein
MSAIGILLAGGGLVAWWRRKRQVIGIRTESLFKYCTLRRRQETSNIPLAAKGATIMGILRIASLTAICAVALIESAYAGGVPVPGPIAGAGIPGLIAGAIALFAWYRQRK